MPPFRVGLRRHRSTTPTTLSSTPSGSTDRKLEAGAEQRSAELTRSSGAALTASDRRLLCLARFVPGGGKLRVPCLDLADGEEDALVDSHASLESERTGRQGN